MTRRAAKSKLPPRSEDALQKACVEWCRLNRITFFALANEGKRTIGAAMRLRALGMRAGAPDLAVCLRGGRTLWIEFKTATGKQSENQKAVEVELWEGGHRYSLIRSIDEFIAAVGEASR